MSRYVYLVISRAHHTDFEQGAQRISPFPSTEDIINRMLLLLLDPKDRELAFVDFGPKDEVILLINNYGGLSTLELGALTQETLEQLGMKSKRKLINQRLTTLRFSMENKSCSEIYWYF